LGRARRFTQN